jgi:large subunit ribosomal protein L33
MLQITRFYNKLPTMAKKKGNRMLIGMECTETGARTYVTQKNKLNSAEKLQLMKYSPRLRKHTLHKEIQRLK